MAVSVFHWLKLFKYFSVCFFESTDFYVLCPFLKRKQKFHQVPGYRRLGWRALSPVRHRRADGYCSGDEQNSRANGSWLRSGPWRQLLLSRCGQRGFSSVSGQLSEPPRVEIGVLSKGAWDLTGLYLLHLPARRRLRLCTRQSLSECPGMCSLGITTTQGASKHRLITAKNQTDGEKQLEEVELSPHTDGHLHFLCSSSSQEVSLILLRAELPHPQHREDSDHHHARHRYAVWQLWRLPWREAQRPPASCGRQPTGDLAAGETGPVQGGLPVGCWPLPRVVGVGTRAHRVSAAEASSSAH